MDMQTYRQTLPLVDTTSEAGPNEQAAGRVTIQDATDDPARQRNGITDGTADQSKEQLVGVHITKR
jgi:hypothetical protein